MNELPVGLHVDVLGKMDEELIASQRAELGADVRMARAAEEEERRSQDKKQKRRNPGRFSSCHFLRAPFFLMDVKARSRSAVPAHSRSALLSVTP